MAKGSDERLRAALRENLKRRKGQARARAADGVPPDGTGEPGVADEVPPDGNGPASATNLFPAGSRGHKTMPGDEPV